MIDFANAQSITIPEGEVARITCNGEILWQKPNKKYKVELEYLESTGTQWIDTGYTPIPATTRFELYFTPTRINDNSFAFGARNNSAAGGAETCTAYKPANRVRQDWAGGNTEFTTRLNIADKFLYTAYNNTVSLNDEVYTGTTIRSTNRLDYNFTLFTVNTAGTVDSRMFAGKIYYAKLYDNDVLVRDLIPVLDNDYVPCMYDKVSGELFYNKGAGEFVYKLPFSEYTQVEYLQSTGTQWLDIGATINTATDTVECIFQNTESNVYKWFFGEHDNNARFALGSGDGANKRNVAYGSNTYKVADTQQYNSQHTFVADENGVFIDGTKIANFASFASTSTLYLFNLNLNSGNYTASAKIWRYKQTRNGELIRDFIPCVRNTDGIAGMYDLVTDTFFTNQGTGEFLYG